MATVKALYRLAGRQSQGFLISIFELMGIDLPVPDHSTLSRRIGQLSIDLPVRSQQEARHAVIDSTGVKGYGEGEWKTRQHGVSKHRTWRKLHLEIDATTGEILAATVSTNNISDDEVLPDLLNAIEHDIEQVSADGAYDQRKCYDAIRERQARAVIPPRKGAKIWQHGNTKAERHHRDENLRRIRKVGRKAWKRESYYNRRSLAETTIFRLKAIFGGKLGSRTFDNQSVELFIKCAMLNRMIQIAKPQSYKLEA